MSLETLTLREDLLMRGVGDEILVYDPFQKKVHTINSTAAEVFKYLKEGKSVEQVIEAFINKYSVDKSEIENDIKELIDKFKVLSFFCE